MTDEHGRKEYFDNTLGIGFDTVVTIRAHKLPICAAFFYISQRSSKPFCSTMIRSTSRSRPTRKNGKIRS